METKLKQKNRVKDKNKYTNFQKQVNTNMDQCVNRVEVCWECGFTDADSIRHFVYIKVVKLKKEVHFLQISA